MLHDLVFNHPELSYRLIALALAGCAHGSATHQPLRLAVNPAPSIVEDGMADIRLTNTSDEEQCVFRDGIETPTSFYLLTELRVDSQRLLADQEGYILPPPRRRDAELGPW